MRGWRASWIVVPALAALAGCAAETGPPRMNVSLSADWDDAAPANQYAFGFTVTVVVNQWRDIEARCTPPPAPVRFTINDEEVGPSGPHPISGCIDFLAPVGPIPTLEVPETITVRYEMGERLLATATFHRVAPGLSAALTVPADGVVRAGDGITVVPPPELPTSDPGYPHFYPLDVAPGTPSLAGGVRPLDPATRLPDGIHVKVPSMTGPVAMVFDGSGEFTEADVTCEGFASCSGSVATVVGPVYLTVQP